MREAWRGARAREASRGWRAMVSSRGDASRARTLGWCVYTTDDSVAECLGLDDDDDD